MKKPLFAVSRYSGYAAYLRWCCMDETLLSVSWCTTSMYVGMYVHVHVYMCVCTEILATE